MPWDRYHTYDKLINSNFSLYFTSRLYSNKTRLPHWLKRRDSAPIGDTTGKITISQRDSSNRCELAES